METNTPYFASDPLFKHIRIKPSTKEIGWKTWSARNHKHISLSVTFEWGSPELRIDSDSAPNSYWRDSRSLNISFLLWTWHIRRTRWWGWRVREEICSDADIHTPYLDPA